MKWTTYILAWFIFLGCKERTAVPISNLRVEMETISIPSTVGEGLEFQFIVQGNGNLTLLLDSSFGSMLFQPKKSNNKVRFTVLPKFTEQAGEYSWKLIGNSKVLFSDTFVLSPRSGNTHVMETYFGPRGVRAGGIDYAMLTVIPTDDFDNPLPDSTSVSIRQQISSKTKLFESRIKDGIAWKLLYGEKSTGRMLVSAVIGNTPSKELTAMISPSNSSNFTIGFERVHEYADANQLISFTTSVIRDKYGNRVSDGTLVNFIVVNQEGTLLKSIGTTLGGVATARMLHPSHAEEWQVKAYITGEAESDMLKLSFKSAVQDFNVGLTRTNRKITVGPILGFMGQLIPEGLLIELEIYDSEGDFIEAKQSNSRSGMGSFELKEGFYPTGQYQIIVRAAGINKEMNIKLNPNEVE